MATRYTVSSALLAALVMVTPFATAAPILKTTMPLHQGEPQVALEVTILTVCDAFIQRIGVDFSNGSDSPYFVELSEPVKWLQAAADQPAQPLLLNDKQVRQLRATAGGDTRVSAAHAPTITVANGRTVVAATSGTGAFYEGVIVRLQDKSGLFTPNMTPLTIGKLFSAKPIVSADRRCVQVDLALDKTDVATPIVQKPIAIPCMGDEEKAPLQQIVQCATINKQGVQARVTIPDGSTALIGGWKETSAVRSECRSSILSRIPYLNRLFKTVGYGQEERQVFVLVTARIVMQEEGETQATPIVSWAKQDGSTARQTKVLAELLTAYDEACAEGDCDQAEKFARAALTLDPTCFRRK